MGKWDAFIRIAVGEWSYVQQKSEDTVIGVTVVSFTGSGKVATNYKYETLKALSDEPKPAWLWQMGLVNNEIA